MILHLTHMTWQPYSHDSPPYSHDFPPHDGDDEDGDEHKEAENANRDCKNVYCNRRAVRGYLKLTTFRPAGN